MRTGTGTHGEGRRPDRARLARRAGRCHDADLADREGERAADPPDFHRPRQGHRRDGCARAQALRDPQDREPPHPGAQAQARQGILRAVDVGAHGRLQGLAAGRPGRRVLPRPAGRADRFGARTRAPALLDQHVPGVGTGSPVPDDRPQRRNQHGEGQRQLAERAHRRDRELRARRRPAEAVAADLPGPVRYRLVRQLSRTAGDGRLPARPRDDDDDPRSVGTTHADGRQPPRVLRIPRRDDGAVGRPRRDRVYRRSPDRRDARPQRPASGALPRSPTTTS